MPNAGFGTRSLVPFGYGDGGGGPTREMMERARRLADLDGSPKVVVEAPSKFFAAAQAEYPHAPVWSGELYLEGHRGTLTSQVEIKQGNRRCENLMREAELWSTAALVAGRSAYPYEELEEIWRDMLLTSSMTSSPAHRSPWSTTRQSPAVPAVPGGSRTSSKGRSRRCAAREMYPWPSTLRRMSAMGSRLFPPATVSRAAGVARVVGGTMPRERPHQGGARR